VTQVQILEMTYEISTISWNNAVVKVICIAISQAPSQTIVWYVRVFAVSLWTFSNS